MRKLIIFIIPFLICACENKTTHSSLSDCKVVASYVINAKDTIMVCDFEKLNDTILFPLSELASKLEIVRLDTCQFALCKPDVSAYGISENYIAIANFQAPIKLFDRRTGRYLRKIGNVGQGPGEYSDASFIQIDEMSNSIYTKSFRNILQFNLSGEYVAKYPLAYAAITILINVNTIRQDITVLSGHSNAVSDLVPIWVQSFDGSVKREHLGTVLGVSRIPESSGYVNNESNSLYVYHRESRSDSLYHYDAIKNHLSPKFTVKWKDEVPSHIYKELPGYYCCFFGTNFSQMILIDKTTGKGSFVKVVIDEWSDDLLWSDLFRSYKLAGYEEFVVLVDPLNVSEKINGKLNKLAGKKFANDLSQDENSWVIIGKWN